VTLITAIYKTYQTEIDQPGLPHVFSKRLQALIDKDEKEAHGEVGRIGWDVFIDGQDRKLTELKVTTVSQTRFLSR